jgi:AmiR/NasT family two-component response regulator
MSISRSQPESLAVVVADDHPEALEAAVRLVEAAGHRVVARESDLGAVVEAIGRHDAQLAVIAVHENTERVLDLVERINDTAACPTVLLFDDEDAELVRDALDRGVDAYAGRTTSASLDSAIALARRRFSELEAHGRQIRDLEAGAQRRALLERAKGVIMERHDVDERRAYDLLRTHARDTRTSLAEVADAVVRARALLGTPPVRPRRDQPH